ncbi:MAG: outer membrane beta-barrel protein [Kordiimonadaceae bacterium]|nr:outer membrane beta-barrel protein [Kordiimonadaceae bacterium]
MTFLKKVFLLSALAGFLIPATSFAADGFDGFYAGIKGGLGLVNTSGRSVKGPFSNSSDSGVAGLFAGTRTEVTNQIVVGIEGDALYYSAGKDWRYGGGALIGLPVNENGLAFAKVGYAKLDTDFVDVDGITLGVGYEHIMSDNLNLRFDVQTLAYKDPTINTVKTSYTGYEVTVGAVFKF